MSKNDSPLPAGPIAYLTGEYPKVSHTFILREIEALRRNGLEVLTCTVRRAPAEAVVGEDQKSEADATFGIQDTAKKAPQLVALAHLRALVRSPRSWFNALSIAWQTRPPGPKALLWQFFYFVEAGILTDYLHRNGVVHLHNHFANSSCSVAMLTSVMADVPYSFTLHGPAIFFEPNWWRIDEKIAHAKFVVCISYFARSQAMLFSDEVHWPKLHIVHCGVRLASYGRHEIAVSGKRVLFIGRLDAVKGGALLVDAFAAAYKEHPDATLTVIGDGPARSALEAKARRSGITANFLGYQPQAAVAEYLREADVLVLPSFAEGVPVVLMEAMASSIPVIASRVAGIPELVEDGVSGYLVPPGDLETLTDRLKKLLSDSDLRARMGKSGREMVEKEFDIDREASRLAALLASRANGLRPNP